MCMRLPLLLTRCQYSFLLFVSRLCVTSTASEQNLQGPRDSTSVTLLGFCSAVAFFLTGLLVSAPRGARWRGVLHYTGSVSKRTSVCGRGARLELD